VSEASAVLTSSVRKSSLSLSLCCVVTVGAECNTSSLVTSPSVQLYAPVTG